LAGATVHAVTIILLNTDPDFVFGLTVVKCEGHKVHVLNILLFEVNISYLLLYITTRRKVEFNVFSLFLPSVM
jgi:hypothetical protein